MTPNIHDYDHVCRCFACAPKAYPWGEERETPDHIGWRFGDIDSARHWMATIWVDGVPEWHAMEVRPGNPGYVVRAVAYSACPAGQHNPATCCTHLCRACGSVYLCSEVIHGAVTISFDRARVPILTGATA